jgi:hypothetical protein
MGLDSANSPWYLFWSGFFAVTVFTVGIVTNVYVHVRKNNCHEPRCLRIGRFPVEGTAWVACHRHHPDPPERDSIREHYHLYTGDKPGRG